MNVTFNPYKSYTTQNKYNPKPQQQQSFTGATAAIGDIAESVAGDSKFLKSISAKYDKACNWVGENISKHLFDNKVIDGIANKIKGKDNAIKFFLIGGSAITSGSYMQRTLKNDKMDKDRKQTLAVNQFLTFLVSTAGALFLDSRLKKWWGEKKEQYFDLNVPNAEAIRNAMKEKNDKIKLKNASRADIDKEPLYKLDSYLKKYGKKHFLNEADYKKFMTKFDGFGLLRSIIVFSMVYRFIVPVAVTKPANILCDKYLAHKKAKAAEKNNIQTAQNVQANQPAQAAKA